MVTVLLTLAAVSHATAGADEAARVARAWAAVAVQQTGHWAGSPRPTLGEARPLRDGGHVVGYLFPVVPTGYIVVSARRDLPPVKAYSTTGSLNPDAVGGMAALLRERLGRAVRILEAWAPAARTLAPDEATRAAETSHLRSWDELERIADAADHSPARLAALLDGYRHDGGEVMVSSAWHQREPYNLDCPYLSGSEACTSALVGCVPLAAAQIMRYWAWPPYGVGFSFDDLYDWKNMPEELTGSSSQAEVAAVNEICHEAGEAADVDYGCEATSGYLSCWWAGCTSMEDAFKNNFRYASSMTTNDRDDDDSAEAWFNRLKGELDKRTPLQYRIPDHSVVIDGWKEVGGTPERFFHVNYGWSGWENLGWYAVDDIPGGEPDEEYALIGIVPDRDVGRNFSGLFQSDASFPYRYVAADSMGSSATFSGGQFIQFLPAAELTGVGTDGNGVRIEGAPTAPSALVSQGDITRGIVIGEGAMTLANGGSVTLLPLGPPRFVRASWLSELRAVSVIWEDGWGSEEGVEVERKVWPSGTWEAVGQVDREMSVYYDTALRPRTLYFYRLRAFNGGKYSDWSREARLQTPDAL